MRLCRFEADKRTHVGLYNEQFVTPLPALAKAYTEATHEKLSLPASDSLLDFLPPEGTGFAAAKKLSEWLARNQDMATKQVGIPTASVQLLVPIPRPNKLILLAGNYNEHLLESKNAPQAAVERAETFPYLFLKPPSTTLTDPGKPVLIPKVSPGAIDWEVELGIVIGRRCKHVSEADALGVVAGYTVVNDISDRKFRPNPSRKEREKDKFFDWLHGKWHDSFCPCGPCITTSDEITDPDKLKIELKLNGQVKQSSSTAAQIFPVPATIAFISSFVTLEPGDIISTGTPGGVDHVTGTYVKPGDTLEASLEHVGTLVSPIVAE